jgi:exopolysaccharide production protein ExoQ
MLHAASKPLGVWFQKYPNDIDAGSPFDRALLITLMSVALGILVRRRFDWSRAIKENKWLIVLIIFELISVLWSDIPFISFRRWARELGAVLMAFIILSEPSPRRAVENIIRRTTYVLIPCSVLLVKYFPEYGVQHNRWSGTKMWIGVTLQKNGLGRLCLIAIFFLIWSQVRRWQGNNPPFWKYQTQVELLILVIALWLMRGPQGAYSATGIIALSVGLLIYIGFFVTKKLRIEIKAGLPLTIVAIIIILGTLSPFTGGSTVGSFASSAGRDTTLTGRTQIWASLLPVAMQRPLLGRGFGGFWTTGAREMFDISEAHSGYLDVLLDLGFSGILLISIFFLWSCRNAQRELSNDFDWGTLWICYIVMALVHNIAETSMNSLTSHLSLVILFLSVSAPRLFLPRQKS